jgi:hypothetical protein
MIDTSHSHGDNNTLLIITLISAVFGNAITDIDLILSIITKVISVISFGVFIIVNHQVIIAKTKIIWNAIKHKK